MTLCELQRVVGTFERAIEQECFEMASCIKKEILEGIRLAKTESMPLLKYLASFKGDPEIPRYANERITALTSPHPTSTVAGGVLFFYNFFAGDGGIGPPTTVLETVVIPFN